MTTFTADKFGANCDTVPAPPGNRHKSGVPWYVMIVEGRYKYVRTLEANEPEELYDLLADPEELTNLAFDPQHAATRLPPHGPGGHATTNLAFDPQHAATVKKLRAAAIAELKRTGAKMVDTLPPVASALATE